MAIFQENFSPEVRRWRKLLWIGLAGLLVMGAGALGVSKWVEHLGQAGIVEPGAVEHAQTAIVLGAGVWAGGQLSPVLQDRVDAGIELFQAGKVDTLLMSGDHGYQDYDEVNSMREYAVTHGVPNEKIFMDHAGFNTYDSMARARQVFQVESAVVVTNRFHLARSVFLARQAGIKAQGVVADRRVYAEADWYEQREFLARCKAFLNCYLLHPPPALGGPPIPITGDARLSHDKEFRKR